MDEREVRPIPRPDADGWERDGDVVDALAALEQVAGAFDAEPRAPGPVSARMLSALRHARDALESVPDAFAQWKAAAAAWLERTHEVASYLKFLPPVPRPHDDVWLSIEAIRDSVDVMHDVDMLIDACQYRGEPFTAEIIEQLATVRRWLNHVPERWSEWVKEAHAWLDAADAADAGRASS